MDWSPTALLWDCRIVILFAPPQAVGYRTILELDNIYGNDTPYGLRFSQLQIVLLVTDVNRPFLIVGFGIDQHQRTNSAV